MAEHRWPRLACHVRVSDDCVDWTEVSAMSGSIPPPTVQDCHEQPGAPGVFVRIVPTMRSASDGGGSDARSGLDSPPEAK